MTFEEATQACDPFGNCWMWTSVPRLDHDSWRHMLVVRTSDGRSTIFNFSAKSCEQQIRRVPNPYDLLWDYTLTDRSGDDWHAGDLNDMLKWGRGLFHDL